MSVLHATYLLSSLALACVGILWHYRLKLESKSKTRKALSRNVVPQKNLDECLLFLDDSIIDIERQVYCVAFKSSLAGLCNVDVINHVAETRDIILLDRQYLPHQPLILPRLMSAMRRDDSSSAELVDIILRDAGLTGKILKMANSSFYRIAREPVRSVEYAVVLLGLDGLKSLVAAAVMEPVLKFSDDQFRDFSNTVWEQALDSAFAAQNYAQKTDPGVCFSANLMALISSVAQVVLFRFTHSVYEKFYQCEPNAETIVEVLETQSDYVVRQIMKSWELGEELMDSLDDYFRQRPLDQCNTLSKALYYGCLVGRLSVLLKRNRMTVLEARRILSNKGLSREMVHCILRPSLRGIDQEDTLRSRLQVPKR